MSGAHASMVHATARQRHGHGKKMGSQKHNSRGEIPRLLKESNVKLGSTTTARYTSKSKKRKRAWSRNITNRQ